MYATTVHTNDTKFTICATLTVCIGVGQRTTGGENNALAVDVGGEDDHLGRGGVPTFRVLPDML